jgi:energy-coupling factor transporter transmembrane protein EcfT
MNPLIPSIICLVAMLFVGLSGIIAKIPLRNALLLTFSVLAIAFTVIHHKCLSKDNLKHEYLGVHNVTENESGDYDHRYFLEIENQTIWLSASASSNQVHVYKSMPKSIWIFQIDKEPKIIIKRGKDKFLDDQCIHKEEQ